MKMRAFFILFFSILSIYSNAQSYFVPTLPDMEFVEPLDTSENEQYKSIQFLHNAANNLLEDRNETYLSFQLFITIDYLDTNYIKHLPEKMYLTFISEKNEKLFNEIKTRLVLYTDSIKGEEQKWFELFHELNLSNKERSFLKFKNKLDKFKPKSAILNQNKNRILNHVNQSEFLTFSKKVGEPEFKSFNMNAFEIQFLMQNDSAIMDSMNYTSLEYYSLYKNTYKAVYHFLEKGEYKLANKYAANYVKLKGAPENEEFEALKICKFATFWRYSEWEKAAEEAKSLVIDDEETKKSDALFNCFHHYFLAQRAFELDDEKTFKTELKNFDEYILTLDFSFSRYSFYIAYLYNELIALKTSFKSVEEGVALLNSKNGNQYYYKIEDYPLVLKHPKEIEALIYEKNKEFDLAIDALQKANYYRPNSGVILFHLARLYYKNRQKTLAIDYLNKFNDAWANGDKDHIIYKKAEILRLDILK